MRYKNLYFIFMVVILVIACEKNVVHGQSCSGGFYNSCRPPPYQLIGSGTESRDNVLTKYPSLTFLLWLKDTDGGVATEFIDETYLQSRPCLEDLSNVPCYKGSGEGTSPLGSFNGHPQGNSYRIKSTLYKTSTGLEFDQVWVHERFNNPVFKVWRSYPLSETQNAVDVGNVAGYYLFVEHPLECPTCSACTQKLEVLNGLFDQVPICAECAENTYNDGTLATCQPCPDNSFAAVGSTSQADCIGGCQPGSYRNSSNGDTKCVSCPPGKFSEAIDSDACTPCAVGMHSYRGKTSCFDKAAFLQNTACDCPGDSV